VDAHVSLYPALDFRLGSLMVAVSSRDKCIFK